MLATAPIGAGLGRGTAALPMLPYTGTVGWGSTVPYGPTNGYATPNGVTGFIGPAAGSLQQPTTWYVRAAGSNNNGGSSSGTAADRTGSDGNITVNTLVFTSASANFTVADIGKGICLPGISLYAKIVAINSTTSVKLSNAPTSSGISNGTWNIGGAWATPEPLLNSNANGGNDCGVRPGDSLYIGAGTYRVVYTLGANYGTLWSSVGGVISKFAYFNGQVNIVGDVTGQYTGDAGMVELTGYTTNDKTAPVATTLLNLNGKSNLAFSNIMFVGGANVLLVTATTGPSQNISFTDSVLFMGGQGIGSMTSFTSLGLPFNFRMDRCIVWGTASNKMVFTLTTIAGNGDYDANVLITNSIITGLTGAGVEALAGGTATFKGGGVKVRNCWGNATLLFATPASQLSTIFPCQLYNSLVYGGTAACVSAGTTGQIVEDYNLLVSSAARTNVNVGTHSISDGSYAPLFHFGQERIWVGNQRPFGEPMSGSPLLAFGNDGAQTIYDLYNRPRPAGSGTSPLPAAGALERGNTAVRETITIHTGANAVSIIGPGYQDYDLAVNSGTVTIGVWCQVNGTYTGLFPQLRIVKGAQAGVPDSAVSFDGGCVNTWQQKTIVLTPNANGIVTVRLTSLDLSGVAKATFDTFSVA